MKINLFFILLNIFVEIQSLVELPEVEDNSIAITVIAIQNTLNNLFTYFKIQNIKHSSELNQYFTIHKLFVSITLRDCDSWKKIASLARVNYIDNKTIYFITQINEVLNEGNNNNAADDIDNKIFSWKLEYLKERYATKRNDYTKGKISNNFEKFKNDVINNDNKANVESKDTILNDEFWQPSGRRIYQGSRTNIREFPFMASVQFFGKFQCAGCIIKSDLIITSASCLQLAYNNRFFHEHPTYLTVQIGSHFYEHGGETIEVQEIYFHPKYDPRVLRHNLALMRLSRKITFQIKTRRVKKIDFDRKPRPFFAHDRITIVGWGPRDRSNVIFNAAQNKLSYSKLDFFPFDECQAYYSEDYVTKRNFCAGFFSKGSGACNRDVGGPGVIDNLLVGVISFASPVCGAPGPTVFTKLGYYADWIDGIMEQEVPSIAVATTEQSPTIYYQDINTRTTDFGHFTPFDTTPWENVLRTIKVYDNLNKDDDCDDCADDDKLLSKGTKSNVGNSRIGHGPKSKLTVTTAVRYTRKTRLGEMSPAPDLDEVKKVSIEKDILNIINSLDVDRIVKSLGPALISRLGFDQLEGIKTNETDPNRGRQTTKRQDGQRSTQMNRFLV